MNVAKDPLRDRIIHSHAAAGRGQQPSGATAPPSAKSALLIAGGGLLAGIGLARLLAAPRSWSGLLAVGAGGALLWREWQRWSRPARPDVGTGEHPDAALSENPVDEALWESFPASDPPAPRSATGW